MAWGLILRAIAAGLIGLLLAASGACAAEPRTIRVQFPRGATSTTVQGSVSGDGQARYSLRVTLTSRNGSTNFNVFAPGVVPGRGEAMFSSTTSGPRMEARIAPTAEHLIQVFLMRNAARRGERAHFGLRIGVTGATSAVAPTVAPAPATTPAPSEDARVGGTRFHATGDIPCDRAPGQPMVSCPRGTVTVACPNGGTREIRFERGVPVSSDGGAVTFERREDLFMIRAGKERFEIREAIIPGGRPRWTGPGAGCSAGRQLNAPSGRETP